MTTEKESRKKRISMGRINNQICKKNKEKKHISNNIITLTS